MHEDLTFLMGKYPALVPGDLVYSRNHLWRRGIDGRIRFGLTAYAVRLMQDVYFLDWRVKAGDTVQRDQAIGQIETCKSVSDLHTPLTGTIAAFNSLVLKDPAAINVDNYHGGWLFEMIAEAGPAMTSREYCDFLAEDWARIHP